MSKGKKVISILGKGWKWDEINDAIKEGWAGEIWGTNDSFLRTPEVDLTFHMHDLEEFLNGKETHSSTKLTLDRAKKTNHNIITTKRYWDNENLIEYPLNDICEYFGVCYFNCTIDYMLAYAIREKPDKIQMFGVNMIEKEEYLHQKPGVEFWTGVALGRGIEVRLQPEVTAILNSKNNELYGYNTPQFFPENKWRISEVND